MTCSASSLAPGTHSVPVRTAWGRIAIAAVVLLSFLIGPASFGWVERRATVSIIIERTGSSIEVFVGVPGEGLVDIFDMAPHHLAEDDGTVDFASLRDGTWDIGDALLRSVDTRLGSDPVMFEATSLMVHPADSRLPFNDAMDGIVAVSVCSVPVPDTRPRLDELYAYSGYIAYVGDTNRPIRLGFAETGRLPIVVEIRDHTDGRLTSRSWSVLPDGGVLTIGS